MIFFIFNYKMEHDETDPLLEHEEEKDDDEETTNPFQPGGSSTPGEDIPMTTMNREKEKGQGIAETSFIEGSPLSRVLTVQMQKHGILLQGYFPMRRQQNSRRSTAKQGSYKSKCLVKAKRLILCLQKTKIQEDKG